MLSVVVSRLERVKLGTESSISFCVAMTTTFGCRTWIQVDVLFYTALGNTLESHLLALGRLAPVQVGRNRSVIGCPLFFLSHYVGRVGQGDKASSVRLHANEVWYKSVAVSRR